MARKLLNSEVAILIEGGASTENDISASQRVWQEYHSPPQIKRREWFNTDFRIELDNWDRQAETKISGAPIRPWTMAGHFYVRLTTTGVPTMLELLEGESLPKPSFREELRQVEKAMRSLWELPCAISVQKAPYLRVARLEKCIVFWLASTTGISELLFAPDVPVDAGEDKVSYRAANGHILVDGVLYD